MTNGTACEGAAEQAVLAIATAQVVADDAITEARQALRSLIADHEQELGDRDTEIKRLAAQVEEQATEIGRLTAEVKRSQRDLNMVLNAPPVWKQLLTGWRKPRLQTFTCEHCDGTGREVPPF